MCWESNTIPIKQVAEENIPIYKICRGHDKIRAYFHIDYIYTLNKVYKQDEPIIVEEVRCYFFKKYTIDKAFHSYLASCKMRSEEKGSAKVCHASYRSSFLLYVMGYIPIGTTYYVNEEGEVASDEIILTDYIEI